MKILSSFCHNVSKLGHGFEVGLQCCESCRQNQFRINLTCCTAPLHWLNLGGASAVKACFLPFSRVIASCTGCWNLTGLWQRPVTIHLGFPRTPLPASWEQSTAERCPAEGFTHGGCGTLQAPTKLTAIEWHNGLNDTLGLDNPHAGNHGVAVI